MTQGYTKWLFYAISAFTTRNRFYSERSQIECFCYIEKYNILFRTDSNFVDQKIISGKFKLGTYVNTIKSIIHIFSMNHVSSFDFL